MAKKILGMVNVTKLDVVNSESSLAFKEMPEGTPIKGAAIVEDEGREYSYLYAEDGTVYAGNSATVKRGVEGLIDLLTEEPNKKYAATLLRRESNNGKEFYTIKFNEVNS